MQFPHTIEPWLIGEPLQVEVNANFDVLLREIVGMEEDFADFVGVFRTLAIVGIVQGAGAWYAGIHRPRIIENSSLMSGD